MRTSTLTAPSDVDNDKVNDSVSITKMLIGGRIRSERKHFFRPTGGIGHSMLSTICATKLASLVYYTDDKIYSMNKKPMGCNAQLAGRLYKQDDLSPIH